MTTKTKPKTDLLDTVKEMVRKIGDEFTSPDEDWDATLWLEDDDGTITLNAVMGDDPIGLADRFIQKVNPARAIFIVSVWRNHREYEELLLLDSVRGSLDDLGLMRSFTALITRHDDKPPTLGPWVEMSKTGEPVAS